MPELMTMSSTGRSPGRVVVTAISSTTLRLASSATLPKIVCLPVSHGVGATEMASVWALGNVLNVEVPATIKVLVHGEFPRNVFPKDLILYLIGQLTAEGANFRVIEFGGEAIAKMPISGRLTICNMSVEAGATSGSFTLSAGRMSVYSEACGPETGDYDVVVTGTQEAGKAVLNISAVRDSCEERRRYLTIDPWVYANS